MREIRRGLTEGLSGPFSIRTTSKLFPQLVFHESSLNSYGILWKQGGRLKIVVLPITTHGNIVTEPLKAGHQRLLLIGAHSRKEGTSGDQSFHHIRIMISDDVKAFSSDGEVVVVVVARRRTTRRLLHVDDERRVPICRLGFAHLRHRVVVATGTPGQVVFNFRFTVVVLGCRDENDFVRILKFHKNVGVEYHLKPGSTN